MNVRYLEHTIGSVSIAAKLVNAWFLEHTIGGTSITANRSNVRFLEHTSLLLDVWFAAFSVGLQVCWLPEEHRARHVLAALARKLRRRCLLTGSGLQKLCRETGLGHPAHDSLLGSAKQKSSTSLTALSTVGPLLNLRVLVACIFSKINRALRHAFFLKHFSRIYIAHMPIERANVRCTSFISSSRTTENRGQRGTKRKDDDPNPEKSSKRKRTKTAWRARMTKLKCHVWKTMPGVGCKAHFPFKTRSFGPKKTRSKISVSSANASRRGTKSTLSSVFVQGP